MKKITIVLLLLVFMLPCTVAAATALPVETEDALPEAFSEALMFTIRFNRAVIESGSDHAIQFGKIGSEDKGDTLRFGTNISDQIVLYMIVEKDTQRVNQALLGYIGDGTVESVSDFLTALGELLYTVEAIDDLKQTGTFMMALDMPEHLEDGDHNAVVIDGLEYAYEVSSLSGILFSVTVVE